MWSVSECTEEKHGAHRRVALRLRRKTSENFPTNRIGQIFNEPPVIIYPLGGPGEAEDFWGGGGHWIFKMTQGGVSHN